MTTVDTKLPPHDIDAEEAVVGSLLLDGSAITSISLDPEDFYSERNSWCYKACQSLAEREVSVNQITLAQELERVEKLETIGGAAYLSHLISVCPTSLDIVYYAEIVHRLSISRQLISAGGQIGGLGYEANPDVSQTLSRADEILLDVRKHGVPSPIITPRDRANLLHTRYEKLYKAEQSTSLKTGLIDLDRHLGGGFYDGDMIMIGSRPSVGKTSLLQFLANGWGQHKKVMFCSGEMSMEAVSDRDVAGLTGEAIGEIRQGGYTDELYSKIVESLGKLDELDVYYYQDSPLTTAKILQAGTAMQLRFGLDVMCVDYLGILDDEYGRTPYERISYISRKLKQVARKLDIPLVVALQLNRALEQRMDRRPKLFDIRESGRIEEDSDVVLFLYREDYYYNREEWEREFPSGNDIYPAYPEGIVEIIIAKQRQGQANKVVKVRFDTKHQVYQNLRKE